MAAVHYFIAEDWGGKISFGGSAIHSQTTLYASNSCTASKV